MGMYTELIFGARLKKQTPQTIIDALTELVDGSYDGVNGVINLGRNPLRGGSYYFGVCAPVSKIWMDEITGQYVISTRGNIKNYDNDIEIFLEWIKPFIDSGSGESEMYAIVTYEESKPILYFLHDD